MTDPPALPYRLPALDHLRLRIVLRAEVPARLVPFQGSMLRGAFGHALKRAVCAMGPHDPCATCRLRHECAYAQIFETPIESGAAPPFLRGLTAAPHPYLFEPRSSTPDVPRGGAIAFDLILFGRAIAYQARAFWAIERMAADGLGAGRARFALARVEAIAPTGEAQELFDGRTWHTEPAVGTPLPSFPLPGDGRRVGLRFETPLRLLVRGRIVPPRDPRALVFAAIRRLLELAHFHGQPADAASIDWTFRPLLDAADAARFTDDHLAFVDLTRYSQRQQRAVELSGYAGTLALQGDLAPLTPILRAAEVLHLGKGAVFGLGKLRLEANAD